ncbi:Protein of unknown function [Mucilaginibacter lappiensis]|uniref:DUF2809 domain-containing protein n=1 Tax=Mucilaginibacter lappiensis TaxID=354630 RepID=A0ABR6PG77_9SPHI|nr:DUF2809 domain-containing protein [Mucilaginibacter lappiensis]MBB6108768.1 hypothetical protein [Mucilaginibacter lappiensis]SIQ61514.1 Protein of unknown function [Mucilaginibacter lappiensis]
MIKSYRYFTPALLLFLLEAIIAWYVHDNIIRPYGGDFLAVLFLYCLIKSFFYIPPFKAALLALLVAYAIEISQYFHLTTLLGVQNSKTITLLLGSSFAWMDILCYTSAFVLIIIIEQFRSQPTAGRPGIRNPKK